MQKLKIRNITTLIDDEDFDEISKYKWSLTSRGYLKRNLYDKKTRKSGIIYLHRQLMNPPKNLQIDHINGNPLDNQKRNLRIATNRENSFNQKKRKDRPGYKGVSNRATISHKRTKPWQARIKMNGKIISLGYFSNIKDAGIAYNEAAKKHYGEFARLNPL